MLSSLSVALPPAGIAASAASAWVRVRPATRATHRMSISRNAAQPVLARTVALQERRLAP
jgi:hypothetical protein